MPKKIVNKTAQNNASVSEYLNSITPDELRRDAKTLAKIFKQTTKAKPKMWGSSIVGYGKYTYYRANGDEGEFIAAGFSIRKSGPVLYIMPGYKDYSELMSNLGPHKLGKSCLYLKSLQNINLKVIAELIKTSVKDLGRNHDVKM